MKILGVLSAILLSAAIPASGSDRCPQCEGKVGFEYMSHQRSDSLTYHACVPLIVGKQIMACCESSGKKGYVFDVASTSINMSSRNRDKIYFVSADGNSYRIQFEADGGGSKLSPPPFEGTFPNSCIIVPGDGVVGPFSVTSTAWHGYIGGFKYFMLVTPATAPALKTARPLPPDNKQGSPVVDADG